MSNNLRNARLSYRIEPPAVFAHKTGTLNGAAHDVGMLTVPTSRVSLVVLTSGEDPVDISSRMAKFGSDVANELDGLRTCH